MRFAARVKAVVGASLLVVSLLAGCSGSSDEPPDAAAHMVHVGDVDDRTALVAVVVADGRFTAYLCGIDDALATHTGWFHGAVEEVDGDTTIAATNASGLQLEATVDESGATGTVTLADGTEVGWNAEPAQDGAGLYAETDAVANVGLIVTNDARTAGSSTSGIGGTGTGTAAKPSVSAVQPTSTPSTAGTPVTVTVPVPGTPTRPATLTPVTRPRQVRPNGPTIVFLVHGMSFNIGTPVATDPMNVRDCSGPRDTPFNGRCEWGPDVIPGIFGSGPGAQVANLAGQDLTGERFIQNAQTTGVSAATAAQAAGPINENLTASALDARGCQREPGAAETVFDPTIARHWVTTSDAAARANPTAARRQAPQLSVFTTWRDSTTGLVASGRRLTRQAYAATRWWEETYGLTPQVLFVAQSFGGLATRFLLSNPADADLRGLNPDGVALCAEDRAKMDYLRDRTTYATTLATPHEGSYLGQVGEGGLAPIREALRGLERGLATNNLARAIQNLDRLIRTAVPRAPDTIAIARRQLTALADLLTTPALRDLRLEVMQRYNTTALAPDKAKRTAASPLPGAAGQLVPVYATLARTPGDIVFDTPRLGEIGRDYARLRPKHQGWVISTTFVAETIVSQLSPDGWGRITGPLRDHRAILDRRARLFDLVDETRALEELISGRLRGLVDKASPYLLAAFGDDAQGVIDALAASTDLVTLPTLMVPIWLDQEWTVDLSGELKVPALALRCGGAEVVLDLDLLLDALLTTFDTVEGVSRALGSADLVSVVGRVATILGTAEDRLLADAVSWLESKGSQVRNAGEGCALPLRAGNWKLAVSTTTVPAPNLVPTGRPVADGEQDTDGAVHAASALGLTLGRTPFFFEHDRGGSWYRLPDESVNEKHNHGLQYANDVGRWFRDRLLARGLGPVPRAGGDSSW